MKKFCISLSPESTAKLEAYCQKKERQRSWVMEKLVSLYLDKLP